MKLIVRPRPNSRYFDLSPRQATVVAWDLAKSYSLSDKPDMGVFKEFTSEYNRRREERTAVATHQSTLPV